MLDLTQERICVTGGAGFLGRFVCDRLRARGVTDDNLFIPRRRDYDLTREVDVRRLYDDAKPTVVIHLAAEVGGIGANRDQPGRFFFANMAMGMHLIEEDVWNGYPEETNAPYGIAKKALFVMLEGYKRQYGLDSAVVVPVNLYGPHDNFDLHTSHVIPALIRKCEEARLRGDDHITCWGTGSASREFLYVDDAAEGILRAAERITEPDLINLGTGDEITIRDLVKLIARLCDFDGRIEWDTSKPDGQPRRQLDVTRARERLDWQARVGLEEGLRRTIEWWRQQA